MPMTVSAVKSLLIKKIPPPTIIRLEPADSHWVKLNNPDGVATDIGDWWENNALGGQTRATVDIKIPEVKGIVGAKAKIRWHSNDRHDIGLLKSEDGITFNTIWSRSGRYTFDEVHEIDLDPECEYYRIDFTDSNSKSGVTRVHKDIEIII